MATLKTTTQAIETAIETARKAKPRTAAARTAMTESLRLLYDALSRAQAAAFADAPAKSTQIYPIKRSDGKVVNVTVPED